MSINFGNLTPNKIFNNKINSLKSTPRFSSLLPLKENMGTKLNLLNSMRNNLFSDNKINFNRYSHNINNSGFLKPISKNFISKENIAQKPNDFTHKKTSNNPQKLFYSEIKSNNKEISLNNSFSEIKSKFLNKKRKYMSSEEIELEKIKKEKEKNKKLMQKNKKLYLKSFNYSPMKITPSPLTTFIPFKLSCNNNSKYIKHGKSNTTYEVNKQNQKIRLKMQQKIEKLTDNKTKDGILLNNVDYLKKQNELYNGLFNKENIINNNIFNDINKSRKEKTPIKEIKTSQISNTQIKKINDKYNILDYIKSLRKSKTNN